MVKTKTTPATTALDAAGAAYALVSYDYDPGAERAGLQAAAALGVDPQIVFKTLMARIDGNPVCAIVPSNAELNMKKLASVFGGKSAEMMNPVDAERLTGYKIGGISPFGQKRRVPVVIEEIAELFDAIYLNGGQRGIQLVMEPEVAIRMLDALTADLLR